MCASVGSSVCLGVYTDLSGPEMVRLLAEMNDAPDWVGRGAGRDTRHPRGGKWREGGSEREGCLDRRTVIFGADACCVVLSYILNKGLMLFQVLALVASGCALVLTSGGTGFGVRGNYTAEVLIIVNDDDYLLISFYRCHT